jgi:hypothetical protein
VVGLVFGKKRSAILELARQGRLPVRVLRIGGSYRVATAELLRVLARISDLPSNALPSKLSTILRRAPTASHAANSFLPGGRLKSRKSAEPGGPAEVDPHLASRRHHPQVAPLTTARIAAEFGWPIMPPASITCC